jgi:hypothetical protein
VLSKDTSSGACSILYVVVVVVVVVVFDVLVVVFGVHYQNSLFLSATVREGTYTDIMSQIECVVCGFCLSHLQLRPDGRTKMPDGPTDGQKCQKVFYSSMD